MGQFSAARKGKLQWFKENDYEVDKYGTYSWYSKLTSLMYASMCGHSEVCILLLSKGATVDAQNSDGVTALMYASIHGHKDICTLLLSKGATVDTQDRDGDTALMYASIHGHKDICTLLLSKGATVDIRNVDGVTSFMRAFMYGYYEVCSVLETFQRTPRTLKYHMLKAKPTTSNKLLLKWNNCAKEIKR